MLTGPKRPVFYRPLISIGLSIWLTRGWTVGEAADKLTKTEAESRLKQLKTQISSLKKELELSRTSLSDEQVTLRS